MFGGRNVVDILRQENRRWRQRLNKISAERAKIRDVAPMISAGIPVGRTMADGVEGLLQKVRIQTAYREQQALKARVMQMETELQAESDRLEQEINLMEAQLSEPLGLALNNPVAGQSMSRGTTINIQWVTTGPIGSRLKIAILKNGILLRMISSGVPADAGLLSWRIPNNLPVAADYQISVQDPISGLMTMSDPFQIN